ncbi:MAG: acetoacetate--CoA ligase [Ilumatobacteraceae bacterium]
MPGTRWFPGGTLNYAEHALAAAAERPQDVAIVSVSQTRARTETTWAELEDAVARCRTGLRRAGVGRGGCVVAYLPNTPEVVVVLLAAASLGATFASCPPEFGVRSVVDRFAQIEPDVLVHVDGYVYGDKAIDRSAEVAEIVAALPSLRHVVGVPYLDPAASPSRPTTAASPAGNERSTWNEFLAHHEPLEFEAVAADHPLYVLYSSGTTGLPKPIVHGHVGITVEHLKVMRLHQELGPSDVFSWFTTTGWMMFNYLVSGLLTGTRIVQFDGNPGWPDLSTLWRVAAEERCTVFGVSAPFVMSCRKAGLRPCDDLDLSALRQIGSTGAPLPAEGFDWLIDAVSATAQPNSISGGTDVCSAFIGAIPTLPVVAGELTRPLLGCAVEAYGPDGSPVPAGQQGELVVTRPMPSMPVRFMGDPDGSRYRASYFAEYPGVWRHGDWITFAEGGGATISGRSDATLNRGGVRLGTADFYTVVESIPEVVDALVVHRDDLPDDETGMGELLLFVALAPGRELDDELRRTINGALRSQLSPRHVPDRGPGARHPAHPLGQEARGPGEADPGRRLVEGTVSKGSLANPEVLSAFEDYALNEIAR